jgi:Phage major tail protein 2.
MATEVQGSRIGFYVRDAGATTPFLRIVCEESVTLDLNNDITTTKTKCGVFKGVSVADFKANGSAVHNIDPTSAEASLDYVQTKQIARTKQEFVMQNEAYTEEGITYSLGEAFRFAGDGYFNSSQATADTDNPMKFTWSFEGIGVPDGTESV